MKNAIIIDDEIICGSVLEDLLKPYSDRLRILKIFNSSLEGLEYLLHNNVDVVFLDVEMPELSGFQLLEKIAKDQFRYNFCNSA